jgi:predicted GIY-YIG superfamily endonuclease
MFYVYVLHSDKDEGLYIGYTGNLRKRLTEHNTGGLRHVLSRSVEINLLRSL